ncbi:MAG: hypothetical protein AAGH99_07735 [Planctomycetota bacterium]
MANFSRQPQLPPHQQPAAAEEPSRRPGAPKPPSQPMAHFAIVGLDHKTGENISTVIEARSEDDAQETALRLGITVHEFKPMHPLAGAAAVQMARSDPHDRFNQHPAYVNPHTGHPVDAPDSPEAPTIPLAAGPGVPGSIREPETSNSAGAFAVLGVVLVVGSLLYFTVLRDGGAQQVMAMIAPPPVEVEAAFDVTEPLNIDLSEVPGYENASTTTNQTLDQIGAGKQTPLRLEATIPPSETARANGLRGSAVIGGQIVTPGQTIAGYRLIQVRDSVVLLQKNGKVVALRITPQE